LSCRSFLNISDNTSSSAIAEKPRYRVLWFSSNVEDWNCKTIFYWHYRTTFDHCRIIGLQSYQIRWKKEYANLGLLLRSRSFKVIEVGTNRKYVCDFL